MCEQTEIQYLDGEVVWVKLGSCWWPGEVVGFDKLPPDVLPSFRKPPIAVVKFFQEDTYEYVKNINCIYKYNCSRKNEFIKKGLDMYRTKHGPMEKFPEDIIRAENATGGDEEILTRDQFQETKKESYAGIFGDTPKKTPGSGKRGRAVKGSPAGSPRVTPLRKFSKGNSDYKVHILLQGSKATAPAPELSTPSTSRAGSETLEENPESAQKVNKVPSSTVPSTPLASNSGVYSCHACNFSTSRLNVMILHNKSHSVTFTAYTPSPVRKKPPPKPTPKISASPKTPKVKKPRKEKTEKEIKKPKGQKRSAEDKVVVEVKKTKTDEEIKSSLLADWDDGDEESTEESLTAAAAAAAESPARPASRHASAQLTADTTTVDKKSEEDTEKPETDSKYEFCEDEPDWPETADAGRKIPRVKRKDNTKSVSLDEDDVAKEVAELLSKTSVPELPSVPDSLKIEENFPEPSVVKSPDKESEKAPENFPEKQPTKSIFKTKTFFRSRHSRSQDAIGKYVAEQLSAVERMDTAECDLNGSEPEGEGEGEGEPEVEPPEPPVDTVKVARLAPKIQLKKMKAQLAQREKINCDFNINLFSLSDDQTEVTSQLCIDTTTKKVNETVPKTDSEISDKINNDSNNIAFSSKSIDDEIKDTVQSVEVKDNLTVTPAPLDTTENNKEIDKFTEMYKEEKNNEQKINDLPTRLPSIEEATPELSNTNEKAKELFMSESTASAVDTNEKAKELFMSESTASAVDTNEKAKELFMSESTASAVDALLSVSRDNDRVTENVSNDVPEDLFEDDKIENTNVNGIQQDNVSNGVEEQFVEEQVVSDEINESETPIEFLSNGQKQVDDFNAVMDVDLDHQGNVEEITTDSVSETVPSESDLQIAEALMNLPSTALKNKTVNDLEQNIPQITFESQDHEHELVSGDSLLKKNYEIELPSEDIVTVETEIKANDDDLQSRFETDQEKSENLNAAQSLVQMSEAFDRKMKKLQTNTEINEVSVKSTSPVIEKEPTVVETSVEQEMALMSESTANKCEPISKVTKYETTSSKLLKMLEEPCTSKVPKVANKLITTKVITPIQSKEKILNIDVANTPLKPKPQSPKQKIIIRRTAPSKNLINNISDAMKPEKIVLSRSTKSADSPAVQTYTIQATPDTAAAAATDANTIIIQQKLRKVANTPPKLQKIKPLTSIVAITSEPKTINQPTTTDDALFDINSMPIVLSDDILTPESIEKMPIVMSDGNILSNPTILPSPSKMIKKQTVCEPEKIAISASSNKTELKTLLINPTPTISNENKATPNILSKSTKLRGTPKPLLVMDKTTGKQKIIMTTAEPTKTVREVAHKTIKEVAKIPTKVTNVSQISGKSEKFILLPTSSSPRPGRTQKIVIDPHSGKAHVLVGKSAEASGAVDNKPVSAKLVAPAAESPSGGTVMIITNAQGTQSRIVLTPEHEKLLFPNKAQNVTQIKAIAQRQAQGSPTPAAAPVRPPTRILAKQKSAIITSKGQLIVGGRVATTVQNISPMPEVKSVPAKRILTTEPKKIIQTVQKTTAEPLIFLQQKSGAVVQLTSAQYDHLQRTGQIVQKTVAAAPQPQVKDNKIVVQKSVTITSNEAMSPLIQKQQKVRARPAAGGGEPSPAKRLKKEMTLTATAAAVPPLAPISHSVPPPPAAYQDLGNIEELLPSTAIVRQPEPLPPPPPMVPSPPPEQAPAPLSDGQLLAVPGENFGGPPGSFYLCVGDNSTLTPIDNRPLMLENNQLVPMTIEPVQPERRDILEAALANSDVFHAEQPPSPTPVPALPVPAPAPALCRVSETSTTLHQPIMTPVEVPSAGAAAAALEAGLEATLAALGVSGGGGGGVPRSLELPITVTDPRIASRPRSMPLLTDEPAAAADSPGSLGSLEDAWSRRLLTPGSDTSDTSAEIPLQPPIQISVSDIAHHDQ